MGFLILIAVVAFFGIIILGWLIPVGLWISARAAGVHIRIFADLVGMRLRRVPPSEIVAPMIKATKAGLTISTDRLEAHYLAGGSVGQVVNALIAADKAGIELGFERAAAIDLAGRDVLDAVQMSVNPKIINVPQDTSGGKGITAVARDGIQLTSRARVTVRADIERLVGGAGEPTVVARVGEGIVTTIGSTATHKQVLENPDNISRTVLEKGLAEGTAFEILSIDIADIDVGKNVGAELQKDQAQAEVKIAKAKAEERRARAEAEEAEMTALVEERKADLVEAEAEVPLAISESFQTGKLGAMDYYNLRNVIADTEMRQTIASSSDEGTTKSSHSLSLI